MKMISKDQLIAVSMARTCAHASFNLQVSMHVHVVIIRQILLYYSIVQHFDVNNCNCRAIAISIDLNLLPL